MTGYFSLTAAKSGNKQGADNACIAETGCTLKEAFKDWIFRDPERREVLVKNTMSYSTLQDRERMTDHISSFRNDT